MQENRPIIKRNQLFFSLIGCCKHFFGIYLMSFKISEINEHLTLSYTF